MFHKVCGRSIWKRVPLLLRRGSRGVTAGSGMHSLIRTGKTKRVKKEKSNQIQNPKSKKMSRKRTRLEGNRPSDWPIIGEHHGDATYRKMKRGPCQNQLNKSTSLLLRIHRSGETIRQLLLFLDWLPFDPRKNQVHSYSSRFDLLVRSCSMFQGSRGLSSHPSPHHHKHGDGTENMQSKRKINKKRKNFNLSIIKIRGPRGVHLACWLAFLGSCPELTVAFWQPGFQGWLSEWWWSLIPGPIS